jgi:pyruvate/2-oxoacid:ferredoxin oxidoreductase beta subunit
VFRNVLAVLGEDTVVVAPPGCVALFSGLDDVTNMKIAGYQCNLENTAASAAGIRAGLDALGNTHTTVLAFAGDGATVDIGIQSLSGMIERGDRVLYVCYDNEAYMNTGIQGSSSTPQGASTTTTPAGKSTARKDLIQIAIAHGIPYAASASVAYLPDLQKKVKKASRVQGPSLIHVHTPCPTGWLFPPAKSIELCRNAVLTAAWVLYEWENEKIAINYTPERLLPLEDYLLAQGRFKGLTQEEIAEMQQMIVGKYRRLLAAAEM